MDDPPWWVTTNAVRTLVAALVVAASLGMIWWGWARLDAGPADLLMRTMVSVVTGALGYLFGRGDVERAERAADEQREEKATAVASLGESAEWFARAEYAWRLLSALRDEAERDPRLKEKIDEALRSVEGRER